MIERNKLQTFYEKDYLPWIETEGWPKRSFSCVKKWLKELGVKKARFDKYRCEICFQGRAAGRRVATGKPLEGDQDLLRNYKSHQGQFENQFEKVKEDKKIDRPDTIMFIYDYSTIHEFSKQKVSFLCSFFYSALCSPSPICSFICCFFIFKKERGNEEKEGNEQINK